MTLFSNVSNLCDHGTSTSPTDGQTDDLPQQCVLRTVRKYRAVKTVEKVQYLITYLR